MSLSGGSTAKQQAGGETSRPKRPSVFGDVPEVGQPSTSKQHAVITTRPVSRSVASGSHRLSGSHAPSVSQPTQTEAELQARLAAQQSVDCQTELIPERVEPEKAEASVSVQSFFTPAALPKRTSQHSIAEMKKSGTQIYTSHTSPTLPELSMGLPSASKQHATAGAPDYSSGSKKSVGSASEGVRAAAQSFPDNLRGSDAGIDQVNVSGVFSKNITQSWVSHL